MSEQDLLKKLEDLRDSAFKEATPNISILKRIKGELFSIKKKDRDFLKPYVLDLSEKLFKSNTSVQGLELDSFFQNSKQVQEPTKEKTVKVNIQEENVEITFDELLKKLLECIQDTLTDLKGYAIIKLSNQENSNYNIKVLYDDNYYYAPIKNKITKTFSECDASTITEFSEKIKQGESPDSNLLCLVLLTSKINNEEAQRSSNDNLSEIVNSFDEFEYCTIKEFGEYTGEFYKRVVEKDDFFEEINFVTTKFLTNGKISFEEEKVIKKVFEGSSAPVLTYKLLKAGNSGAKVIEIRQIPPFTSEQYERRFIVKFNKRDEKRKLKLENKKFADFIDSYEGFEQYNCSFFSTPNYDALKYTFAKSKGALNSYSFAEVLDNSDNPYFENSIDIIDSLFGQEIFGLWRKESIEKHTVYLRDLYSNYVNFEKVKEQVLIVKNISANEFDKSQFKINLDKLLNFQIETNKKICHGDLHSENFFKDDKEELFLIDFGFTGIEHSVIDHTSLECSLKFNHIPKYIELETLLKIEQELLLDETFVSSYVFKEAEIRKDLFKYCEIIKRIRKDSEQYLLEQNSKIEYYISLFFMTYRQVRYKDMNQLYAIHSAEILLEKLIVELGL